MTKATLLRRATETLEPLHEWEGACHSASLHLVTRGIGTRVARGTCEGVGGQHSWVVVGEDCYAEKAVIIDPTLWGYDASVTGVWVGSMRDGRHRPHGHGSIWDWGRPAAGDGSVIKLTPRKPLSRDAQSFLRFVEPLDVLGWSRLANAPVQGWPASEIIAAMDDTPGLGVHIPIDILGMITGRNPGGLYR